MQTVSRPAGHDWLLTLPSSQPLPAVARLPRLASSLPFAAHLRIRSSPLRTVLAAPHRTTASKCMARVTPSCAATDRPVCLSVANWSGEVDTDAANRQVRRDHCGQGGRIASQPGVRQENTHACITSVVRNHPRNHDPHARAVVGIDLLSPVVRKVS